MNRIWLHPEFRATKNGYVPRSTPLTRARAAAIPLGAFTYKPLSQTSAAQRYSSGWDADLFPIFAALSALVIAFCVSILLLTAKYSPSPEVVLSELLDNPSALAASDAKYAFLSELSLAQRRETASKVGFVSEIIRNNSMTARENKRLALSIVTESLRADYDPFFVAAVIKTESLFNQRAISSQGALGLMQILPSTERFLVHQENHEWRGVRRLTDAEYNLRVGIGYLKYLDSIFMRNKEHVLIAYNWGPANLSTALRQRSHIPISTVKYARTILHDHRRWKASYETNRGQYQYFDVNVTRG
jgi:soluble lytic murein transglycosylase-like protein